MHVPHPQAGPRFPGNATTLSTPFGDAMVHVNRMTIEPAPRRPERIHMDAEDAYVALFQLRDHPSHDIRLDGRLQRTQPTFDGALHIIHLEREPEAWLEAPADTLMIHLPRGAIDGIARAAGACWDGDLRVPAAWRTPDPVLARLQPLLLETLATPSPERQWAHDHLVRGLATHLACAYGGLHRRGPVHRGGLSPRHERLSKEMLVAGMDASPSIAEIARACGLSPDHFSRAFKASTGLAPSQWLQLRRIDRAKSLLRSTRTGLSEIALACGFSDQSHLSRVFARHVGTTPGAWRRQDAPSSHRRQHASASGGGHGDSPA